MLMHFFLFQIEELMQNIRNVKESGNKLFGTFRYKAAARKYHKSLRFLEYAKQSLHDIKKGYDSCKYVIIVKII